ncbi:hypothetical protein ACFZDK_11660 [Streptomyces sp. NPDC007901]|uniref:hypothetical protein n=1 Tax=Streptomyces sp. NPDC007901 TaxID=3364785 RepID=UPI0036E0E026
MLGRTSARPTARYFRSVAAAVAAVAALIIAANAGPARATDAPAGFPAPSTAQHTATR